jgi:uncharacterized protein
VELQLPPPAQAAEVSPDLLANAEAQIKARGLDKVTVIDVDAHHLELEDWDLIAPYIDHPTIRRRAEGASRRTGVNLVPQILGDQLVAGRIKRTLVKGGAPAGLLRHLERFERDLEMLGIDRSIVFPTSILSLGLHPEKEVEKAVAWAYARWMTEDVLPRAERVRSMLYLPFKDPAASLRFIEEFGHRKGVVGFMVTTARYEHVHDNAYMPLYRALEEAGLPIAFHPLYNYNERALETLDKFIGVHSLGFPLYNMVHLANVVINGLPERFPKLKWVWMEAGVAWIPFVMLRLDNEFLMRPSEAPLLKRKPSEYIREFFYTTQPLEWPEEMSYLASVFELCHGATQFMYSSDYPHWDFDLPTRVYDLPFLSEEEKRAILAGNALRVFPID